MHIHIHTNTYISTYTYTHIQIHTNTYTHTYTKTHTHTTCPENMPKPCPLHLSFNSRKFWPGQTWSHGERTASGSAQGPQGVFKQRPVPWRAGSVGSPRRAGEQPRAGAVAETSVGASWTRVRMCLSGAPASASSPSAGGGAVGGTGEGACGGEVQDDIKGTAKA